MWKRYFKFVKLKPGKVVTALYGDIDFNADNIGIENRDKTTQMVNIVKWDIVDHHQILIGTSTPEIGEFCCF